MPRSQDTKQRLDFLLRSRQSASCRCCPYANRPSAVLYRSLSRLPNSARQATPATVNLALLLPLVVHHDDRLLHQRTKSFMAVLDGEYLCLSDD